MINTKHLLELLVSFLIADIIICLILLFSESGISFLEIAITIGLSVGGYFLCFLMLFALFSTEFQFAFSGNVIAQLIGTFIGMIGCLAKVHEGTIYLLGFVVLVPLFVNALIWEYFPKFYLKD